MSTLLPSTRPIPSTTTDQSRLVPARPPVSSDPHIFATDHHASKPTSHELDHHTTPKPHHRPATHLPAGRGRDRGVLSSDDTALTKQVVATHAPDIEELDVRPILAIIEDIMRLARPSITLDTTTAITAAAITTAAATMQGSVVPSHAHAHVSTDDKAIHYASHRPVDDPDHEIFKVLAYPINKISSEMICKCSSGGESHSAALDLLRTLSGYAWDAKIVIIFAAFSINYGDFWLVEQLHTKNPLAKNIAALMDLPGIMSQVGDLTKRFEAVLELLTQILNITHCVIEFKELMLSHYISRDVPEVAAATSHIPTAVYWVVRGLLACASTLLNLIGGGGHESWEIVSLSHKLLVINEHLRGQLRICTELIDGMKAEAAYLAFIKIMESAHIDNMKVLKAMIKSTREDQLPLFDGSKRANERIEALRLKYVLLLISDLELPHEELHILHSIYSQHPMRHEYEVLWLPIHNSMGPSHDTDFYNLRNNMPWHSVDHPSLVEPVAARYIREYWKFVHTPMLVVLDPQGKPANLDALPMIWIWGTEAFPFTRAHEGALWAESTWNIYLLADSIDQRFAEWIQENKVICLYGGEDIEWIRRFTQSARLVANALQVPMEMLYVGKRYPKEKVRRCHEVINREKLSHIFSVDYYDYVWFFWVRLWSMWNSKKQVGKMVENDRIMQEIMDILSYDSSEQGWAVFSRGNFEITKGNGDKVMPVLENYTAWADRVDHPDKFVTVLDEELGGFHPEHHCTRLILPGQAGYIPERVVCSECGKVMDKYVMYRCCTD